MEYATMSVGKVVSVYVNVSDFGSLQCHTIFEWNAMPIVAQTNSSRVMRLSIFLQKP